MALSFIYGGAGSGKSTYVQNMLIEEAGKNPAGNFLLLVPDQFTMQTQSDIVKRNQAGGIINIDVLSFGRLAYRVFEETGAPRGKVLDDTGKSLVLRHVAASVSESMPYIGANLSKTGYIHEVKSSISEFMQYGISPKDLKNLALEGNGNLFSRKISDLAVIYEAFTEYGKDRYISGEESLEVLCRKLDNASFIKNSTIVFDGFTGFTPVQEKVILKLLTLAENVYITVTLSDPEELTVAGGEEKLFYLSRCTANRLISMAGNDIPRGNDIKLDSPGKARFRSSGELGHLEANLFRYPYRIYEDKCKDISITASESLKTEVNEVCLNILKLVRENGYAYRDIAIVTGNLSNYADLFERRFKELEIPCFIDKTRGIRLNPFTEYIRSALQIIINNYSYDSVFHFLKSGFTGISSDDTDRLDKYVRSLNIRGKSAYHKEFTRIERGTRGKAGKEHAEGALPGLNLTREALTASLECLERKATLGREYAQNLYDFIVQNDSYNKLREREEKFEAEGNPEKAVEYGQIYRLIMELLDTIVTLVGDEKMTVHEFYKILDAGIGEITVGTIPVGVDRIVVGDIERTRLNEVKALFFTGINDGNIPKNSGTGGILSENDRQFIKDRNFELAPSPREEMYRQKLYLYMNMCKPREKLFLSYAATDRDGKGIKPAYLIGTLKKLFPLLKVIQAEDRPNGDKISSLKDSYRHFAGLMRKQSMGICSEAEKKLAVALYEVYRTGAGCETGERLMDAAFAEYVSTPLSQEIVEMIYGSIISASISRMEKYAQCAYAHFLNYGMELAEAGDGDFSSADLGTVYHGVLDRFALRLSELGLTWADFDDEQGEEILEEIVTGYVSEYDQGILKDDAAREYTILKIKRILRRTIDTLKFQASRGRFTTDRHEFSFAREMVTESGNRLALRGTIDRVDLYEKDGEIYVKIIDYKSGNRDVNISNIYFGLEQQLAIYMSEAVRQEKERNPEKTVHPSAMLYYNIDNPIVKEKADGDIERAIRKELKLKGLVMNSGENMRALDSNLEEDSLVIPIKLKKDGEPDSDSARHAPSEEEINNLLAYSERMAGRIANRVLGGDISISPFVSDKKDSCKYCSYKNICRFDERIDGFRTRNDSDVTEEEIEDAVLGGNENGDYLF